MLPPRSTIARCATGIALTIVAAVTPVGSQPQESPGATPLVDCLPPYETDAATALVVTEATLRNDGSAWTLQLRNEDWRTISAWAVDTMVGADDGTARLLRRATDRFLFSRETDAVDGSEGTDFLPLRPGDETSFVIETPAKVEMSADRFSRGHYTVASLQVSFVAFDDGTCAGSPRPDWIGDFYGARLEYLQVLAAFRRALENLASGRASALDATLQSLPENSSLRGTSKPLKETDPSGSGVVTYRAAMVQDFASRVLASRGPTTDFDQLRLQAAAHRVAALMLESTQQMLDLAVSRMPEHLRDFANVSE